MDRRKYLKTLAAGTLTTGVLVNACAPEAKKEAGSADIAGAGPARLPSEIERYKKVMAEKFFDDHEIKTLNVLVDIIIPKDDVSGSATDAKVPEFLEFIVKDMPRHKTPMRGGLKWLDLQCMNRYTKAFTDCTSAQQMEMIDRIAWPEKAAPDMRQGVAFFNLLRDLTATGFYTTKIGIQDIGYIGNTPNQWNGVPKDVLDQFGLKYDPKLLPLYVTFDS
jgi:hypothetical protein